MDHTGVKRRMEVIGGDGVHVGTVDSVEHGKIISREPTVGKDTTKVTITL